MILRRVSQYDTAQSQSVWYCAESGSMILRRVSLPAVSCCGESLMTLGSQQSVLRTFAHRYLIRDSVTKINVDSYSTVQIKGYTLICAKKF